MADKLFKAPRGLRHMAQELRSRAGEAALPGCADSMLRVAAQLDAEADTLEALAGSETEIA